MFKTMIDGQNKRINDIETDIKDSKERINTMDSKIDQVVKMLTNMSQEQQD